MFRRPAFHTLLKRVQEPRRFIQGIAGPRQTGKTTIARQVAEAVSFPVHFATADEPLFASSCRDSEAGRYASPVTFKTSTGSEMFLKVLRPKNSKCRWGIFSKGGLGCLSAARHTKLMIQIIPT